MAFTKEQAVHAKYYLQRTAECALLAYHTEDEAWGSKFWLREAEEAFKKAATELGYLIEPIQSGAVGVRPEAGSVGDTAPPTSSPFPTSSSHRGFAVEGQ